MSPLNTIHPRRTSSHPATLKPPPPLDASLSSIENSLSLTALPELGPNIFTNSRPQWQPTGARGIYGGSVIAQSLLAALQTVPPQFHPHSMHCFFLLAGNASVPIIYHVDTVREGRSFHTRAVQARQHGRSIFATTISFSLAVVAPDSDEEDGDTAPRKRVVQHSSTLPETLPKPEDCKNELDGIERMLKDERIDEEVAAAAREQFAKEPFEWRRISMVPVNTGKKPADRVMRSWVRSKSPIVDPRMQYAGLAYFSDSWFIGTVGRVNREARRDNIGMMVSLDHTIWFHLPGLKVDAEWLLVENQSTWAGEERGLVHQKIWDQQGRLVASCAQEGMVRLKDGREGDEYVPDREQSKL
ncbi:Thioesterase/thiol ester dehydrase-isomerase [Ascodesmis nigricans]|uniref:Thioesterase/thiol ester dehydrase-isomerase n=1 Tax=Ascodesmis nigricans TaxID=341454 RepID=A0A4S2MVQ1_9PEZI|nr:Thioesterase/thiol ester dehydrase-isomerase [Ascodesmis nigricans]